MNRKTPQQTKADYDEENDTLFIYGPRKTTSSLKFGTYIIDLDKNQKVSALEILDASKMLKETGVTKEILLNVKSARLKSMENKGGFIYIYFTLIFSLKDELREIINGPIAVPAAACA